MSDVLNSQQMAELCAIVEEAARSTREGVKYFVEPAGGSLRRAMTRRHHTLFGRRGSGKSSLLLKVAADLTVDRRPIAVVDLEPFKGRASKVSGDLAKLLPHRKYGCSSGGNTNVT